MLRISVVNKMEQGTWGEREKADCVIIRVLKTVLELQLLY